MSNQVSGLAGYNFYLNVSGTWTKQNQTPITSGPFTFTGLDDSTDYSASLGVTAVDNAGNESWPPVSPATGTAETLNPTPDESPMASADTAAIDAIVAKCIAAGAGPGVTVAVVSPKGYYTKSYGSGTGNSDHYRIASQTKTFTGTAVLRCVDAGLISLSDSLSKYLPGYPTGANDPTIQQIMMMQSGIYDYELANIGGFLGFGLIGLAEEFTINPTMAYTVSQIISLIKAGGSMFTPGSAYYYTNSNYYVLARIVEAVDPAQRTIDKIIAEDILTPLGMVNTVFQLGIAGLASPAATLYDNGPLGLALFGRRNVTDQNTAFIWAAGAIESVISDMILWGKELRDGTLLSPAMHELRMTTFAQQPNAGAARFGLNFDGPPTFGYGLGFIQVGSWFGHDGSWLGCDSCTLFEPATGSIISVYENFQTGAPHVLASLTTVWYEIATYLFPGSTKSSGYLSGIAATGTVACSLPGMSSAATGAAYAVGAFQPYTEFNQAQTNEPVPDGTSGCWVTMLGEGGPGGTGTSVYNCAGGAGGGGGGRVNRVWIPVSALGSSYSVSFGTAGVLGSNGADSVFTSGSVMLTANGGAHGTPGGSYGGSGATGGAGGAWSAIPDTINGVAVTGANGSAGGLSQYVNGGSAGGSNTSDAGPGGGGGRGSYGALSGAAGAGGKASTVAANTDAASPPPLHAGGGGSEGQSGHSYGAGGGGGYSYGNVRGEPGGLGGSGGVLVEWVD